jgi:hypothetical protein
MNNFYPCCDLLWFVMRTSHALCARAHVLGCGSYKHESWTVDVRSGTSSRSVNFMRMKIGAWQNGGATAAYAHMMTSEDDGLSRCARVPSGSKRVLQS